MASQRSATVLHGREGSYALLEVIGKGAYGTVYKGIWREVGRHVAIKRASRSRFSSDEEKALQTEIQLFKNLKYSHIVKYIEAIDDPHSSYLDIVMEYVEGGSLFNIIRSIRRSKDAGEPIFDEKVVANFVRQVVLGLRYLHRQGVVHRDIKCANILVTKESHVKLADFGVASIKPADQSNQMDAVVAGSPYWMAPEIIDLIGSSTASDIWSVGCTVVELLTGFPPYHELSELTALFRIVTDDCPPLPPNLSIDCQDILKKCFNKDMHTRISAAELLQHRWLKDHEIDVPSDPDEEELAQPTSDLHSTFSRTNSSLLANDSPYSANTNRVAETLGMYEESVEDFDDLDFGDTSSVANSAPLPDSSILPNGSQESPFELSSTALGRNRYDQDAIQQNLDLIAIQEHMLNGVDIQRMNLGEDPFKDVMEDPEVELERERERKQKEIWETVKAHVASLGKDDESHIAACTALVEIFRAYPEQRHCLIYDPGLNPIIEVLEDGGSNAAIEAVLRVSLSLFADQTDEEAADGGETGANVSPNKAQVVGYPRVSSIKQDLCLAGFLPVVMKYCRSLYPLEIRLLSAKFMEAMLEPERTLQMIIACRGFIVFVDMLEKDIIKAGELIRVALTGIDQMLSMDNQRHKRDFCRRFASCGLLDKIVDGITFNMNCLEQMEQDKQNEVKNRKERIEKHISTLARLLQTFAARADTIVKSTMITQSVIDPIIHEITNRLTPPSAIHSILSCIRDLSRDPLTHVALQRAYAIEKLVQYLSVDMKRSESNPRHIIISSLHNLCIVSPARQEVAAKAGLVPHLQSYIMSKDINLRSLCTDMYSGFACAGHETRVEMAKHSGIDFYVELLVMLSAPGTVHKWQAKVLQSILEWLDDDSEYVESRLVFEANRVSMCNSLAQLKLMDVEGVLEPYLKVITVSSIINKAFGESEELITAMVRWLEGMYEHGNRGGPRSRLLLLRALLAHARLWTRESIVRGLIEALKVLLKDVVLVRDEAITVREQANLLLSGLENVGYV